MYYKILALIRNMTTTVSLLWGCTGALSKADIPMLGLMINEAKEVHPEF